MARSRATARSKPKVPVPPSQTAEPSPTMKGEVPEPPVNYRRLGINLALLVILSTEAGLVFLARPIWMTGLIAILTLLGTIWGVMAGFVFGWVLGVFKKQLEVKQRALFQNPRLTPYLAGLALLGAVPGAFALPWVLDPPPLLWVLPRGVYNEMTEAREDSGFRYILKIEQDGRSLTRDEGEVVTGRGSIYVGRDPARQLAWVDRSDEERLKDFTSHPDVLKKWTGKEFRKVIKAPLRKGRVELVLEYCTDGRCDEITRQVVQVTPKVNQIFLDERL